MSQALSTTQPATIIGRWYQYITVNVYFLGLSVVSQTMTPLVVPLLVQQFVGEEQKGTAYGNMRLWGLMVALLAQAFWGMLSDHSTLHWGRRRPFIFGGTVVDLIFIVAIGGMLGMSGVSAYWLLFVLTLMLQVSTNAAQAAQQALIPDVVPDNLRGRFSAVKTLFEVPLPVLIISFTIGRIIGSGNMWGGILLMTAILVVTMLITMLVPEQPPQDTPAPLDWRPFLRLFAMTALFTAIILGVGAAVTLIGNGLAGSSTTTLMIGMGAAGLIAMSIAVAIGVWTSIRLGVGDAAKSNPSFTWWVINRLAFLIGVVNLSSFVVFYLQARLGLEKEKAAGPAANMLLLVGLFVMAFALVSGWLSDRFGHKRLVGAAGIVAALGTLIALSQPSLLVIYIGACFIGAATGMFYTSNWALGTEIVPKEEAGRYLGISNLAGAGAGAVGAYIGGPIADYFTIHVPGTPGLGYVVLFSIYGILFLASVAALTRVHLRPASAD